MPNNLELPDDLNHLIEKREGDRREASCDEANEQQQDAPANAERRSNDRRKNG